MTRPRPRAKTCPFCDYSGPSPILWEDQWAIIFAPLEPVVPKHVLVVPREHVRDWAASPHTSMQTIAAAAEFVRQCETAGAVAREPFIGDCNLIASTGPAATQTVEHLHFHIIPRRPGDGLALPWSDPQP